MVQSRFGMDGKVAVVTGGAGLLGKAIVKALLDSGATVYVADKDIAAAQIVCGSISGVNAKAHPIQLDIADEQSVLSCVKLIVLESGKIDVWVNNAYPRTQDWGKKFEDIPFESFLLNTSQHLGGYCLCCQKVAEVMKLQKSGSIINMASIYGVVGPDFSVYGNTSMTMPAAYAAIKGGIVNFSRYLAAYYGPHGIRVNTISPGGVFDNQPNEFVENYVRKAPLRRMAMPDDIVGAVIYLASDAASYVTGHNLMVDGGWSAT